MRIKSRVSGKRLPFPICCCERYFQTWNKDEFSTCSWIPLLPPYVSLPCPPALMSFGETSINIFEWFSMGYKNSWGFNHMLEISIILYLPNYWFWSLGAVWWQAVLRRGLLCNVYLQTCSQHCHSNPWKSCCAYNLKVVYVEEALNNTCACPRLSVGDLTDVMSSPCCWVMFGSAPLVIASYLHVSFMAYGMY